MTGQLTVERAAVFPGTPGLVVGPEPKTPIISQIDPAGLPLDQRMTPSGIPT